MKAMLVVQVENGYALAPYEGEVPADFIQKMRVESEVASSTYSYKDSVARAMKQFFEPVIDAAPKSEPQPVHAEL